MATPPAPAQRYKRKVPRAHPSRVTTVAPVEVGVDPPAHAQAGIPPPPGLEESQESKNERLRREAASIEHMMTHVPKNPFCSACSRAKTMARPHRANAPSDGYGRLPEDFGDEVTADYLSVNPDDLSWHGERFAAVMYDRASRWLQCFPKLSNSAEHTGEAFRSFMGHKLVKSFTLPAFPKSVQRHVSSAGVLLLGPQPTSFKRGCRTRRSAWYRGRSSRP